METPSAPVPRPPPPAPRARTSTARTVAVGLVFGLVGAACGYFGVTFLSELLPATPGVATGWKLAVLALLPALWLLAVGFHEFGHLAGGWIGGGRFLLWAVGPVIVQRTPAGLRVAWNARVNPFGGLAACLPREPTAMTPQRAAVMIVGGPVFSLLLVVLALWGAAWAGTGPLDGPRYVAHGGALVTAALSLLVFAATALPFTTNGFKSDALRAIDLLRGDRRSSQEAALLVLTTASLGGERPAHHDPELVARATALQDGSLFDLYGHLVAYAHAADRGAWTDAQACLDHLLTGENKVAPYVRAVARCEYAWMLATRTDDVSAARAWLDSAGPTDLDPATRLRAEAAVLLAEGRRDAAAAKARDGLNALATRSLSPTRNAFAADALEDILRRAT